LSAVRQEEKGRKKDGRKKGKKEKKEKRKEHKDSEKKQYFQNNSVFPYYLINGMIFEKKDLY